VTKAGDLRNRIKKLVEEYYQEQFAGRTFDPATDLVHYAGRVFDADEVTNVVDAGLDFFLTANRFAEQFEADFAEYLNVSNALLVNSGSSSR
jgi:CDP-6-deoxy-D-xylo-4-hexulose-3-dehydrase